MEFSAKLRLEMVVEERLVEPVIEAILEYAATGEVGDGKIFIFPVDEAIRIRTKERGAVAVY